jgi:hypothetical protein
VNQSATCTIKNARFHLTPFASEAFFRHTNTANITAHDHIVVCMRRTTNRVLHSGERAKERCKDQLNPRPRQHSSKEAAVTTGRLACHADAVNKVQPPRQLPVANWRSPTHFSENTLFLLIIGSHLTCSHRTLSVCCWFTQPHLSFICHRVGIQTD